MRLWVLRGWVQPRGYWHVCRNPSLLYSCPGRSKAPAWPPCNRETIHGEGRKQLEGPLVIEASDPISSLAPAYVLPTFLLPPFPSLDFWAYFRPAVLRFSRWPSWSGAVGYDAALLIAAHGHRSGGPEQHRLSRSSSPSPGRMWLRLPLQVSRAASYSP